MSDAETEKLRSFAGSSDGWRFLPIPNFGVGLPANSSPIEDGFTVSHEADIEWEQEITLRLPDTFFTSDFTHESTLSSEAVKLLWQLLKKDRVNHFKNLSMRRKVDWKRTMRKAKENSHE